MLCNVAYFPALIVIKQSFLSHSFRFNNCPSGIRKLLNQAEQKSEQYYQDYYSYNYVNQIPNCHILIIETYKK